MRKFRLIKEFPGSPRIGTVVLKGNSSDPNPELYGDEQNYFFFKVEDVENYPEFWEEVKNLLVVTYEGVKLYEGDTCYCTHGNDDTTVREVVADSSNTFYYSIKDVPVFAKKENAEEYVLFRKPCLSLRDLLSVWGDKDEIELYKTAPLFLRFKELAKTK